MRERGLGEAPLRVANDAEVAPERERAVDHRHVDAVAVLVREPDQAGRRAARRQGHVGHPHPLGGVVGHPHDLGPVAIARGLDGRRAGEEGRLHQERRESAPVRPHGVGVDHGVGQVVRRPVAVAVEVLALLGLPVGVRLGQVEGVARSPVGDVPAAREGGGEEGRADEPHGSS